MAYDNWLDNEIKAINYEIKIFEKNKKRMEKDDNKKFKILVFLLFILTLATVYAFSEVECPHCGKEIVLDVKMGRGVYWRCKKCLNYNWAENPDWQGCYYCNFCGTKKDD
jgi:tRNA(Ile2) C34 agmatinyltransferase TiaS